MPAIRLGLALTHIVKKRKEKTKQHSQTDKCLLAQSFTHPPDDTDDTDFHCHMIHRLGSRSSN